MPTNPTSASPRVTAIIPTYNRSHVLRHAVASVLGQSFADFELLVVGDGCTDDSASVVAGFSDPRLRWINLPANSGHQSAPNNEGLRQAEGELIAYLGHDDLWMRHHLATLVAGIEAGADLVCSLNELVGPGERFFDLAPPRPAYVPGMSITPSALMHRRQVTERIGGWRDYREIALDPEADLCRRATAAGFTLTILPRLTAVKFPAAWRRDIYRRGDDREQAAWAVRIAAEPDIEQREMVRLVYAGKLGGMSRMRPYRLLWGDLWRETLRRCALRLRARRFSLAGKGGRVDAARRYKGLARRP
jgi:glycosyltransferase involved in cell wall biosynthesis